MLSEHSISATVMDARFCKPLDTKLIRKLAKSHPALITVEEGCRRLWQPCPLVLRP